MNNKRKKKKMSPNPEAMRDCKVIYIKNKSLKQGASGSRL
jgi:hypothetical protein